MTAAIENLAPLKVTLAADAAGFEAALAELSKLLVNAPDGFTERLATALDGGCELVRLDSNGLSAPGTNKLTVALQPSEFMNRLMATARAGDFDMPVFDGRHDSSSVGCLNNSNEDRAPGESQGSSGGSTRNSQGGVI